MVSLFHHKNEIRCLKRFPLAHLLIQWLSLIRYLRQRYLLLVADCLDLLVESLLSQNHLLDLDAVEKNWFLYFICNLIAFYSETYPRKCKGVCILLLSKTRSLNHILASQPAIFSQSSAHCISKESHAGRRTAQQTKWKHH